MIPCLMATQHPDSSRCISVYEEVDEAIEAYTRFSCDEVMIDYEGKLTPYHQVEWIIEKAFEYGIPIGKEYILTPRIPNDDLEDLSRHIIAILEAFLANIKAQHLGLPQVVRYVIIPMTENVRDSIRIQRRLYKIERVMSEECGLDPTKALVVIPLIETVDRQIHVDSIVEAFHRALLKEVSFFTNEVRVFLGKSDSALLHGHLSSSLALKIALNKLYRWGEEHFISVRPILGMGKPPFRGYLSPENISSWVKTWRGYSTVTIQSALRYNTSLNEYMRTISLIRGNSNQKPDILDPRIESILLRIIPKIASSYRRYVVKTVNGLYSIFDLVPPTRERMQYTEYHRVIENTKIPRAIKFVAGYYTIGLPPTLLDLPGLNKLNDKLIEVILEAYPEITIDLEHDLAYYNYEIAKYFILHEILEEIDKSIKNVADKFSLDIKQCSISEYWNLAKKIPSLIKIEPTVVKEVIKHMAEIRGFLG